VIRKSDGTEIACSDRSSSCETISSPRQGLLLRAFSLLRRANPPEILSETGTNEIRLGPRRWRNSCKVSTRVMVHHITIRRHVGARSDGITTRVRDAPDPSFSSLASPLQTSSL